MKRTDNLQTTEYIFLLKILPLQSLFKQKKAKSKLSHLLKRYDAIDKHTDTYMHP